MADRLLPVIYHDALIPTVDLVYDEGHLAGNGRPARCILLAAPLQARAQGARRLPAGDPHLDAAAAFATCRSHCWSVTRLSFTDAYLRGHLGPHDDRCHRPVRPRPRCRRQSTCGAPRCTGSAASASSCWRWPFCPCSASAGGSFQGGDARTDEGLEADAAHHGNGQGSVDGLRRPDPVPARAAFDAAGMPGWMR